MSKPALIALAAGGTGGHLFPALSLAGELRARGFKILLFTDERGLRWEDKFQGAEILLVPAATTARVGLMGKAAAGLTILRGLWQSWHHLGRLKPDVMVGFGGYPSIPPMLAALLRRKPTIIQEQNGVMGRANRAIATRVSSIAVTIPDPVGIPAGAKIKQELIGTPVRPEVIAKSRQAYVPLSGEGEINLVVFGGSQGAQVFSEVVPAAIKCLPAEILARLRLVQQCREDDLPRARAEYEEMNVKATLAPFFDDLPKMMADAHLIISRSGASTVCELGVLGRPAILVPLPQALDGDQAANAKYLVEAGGAWLMPQNEFTAEALANLLVDLFRDPSALSGAASAAKTIGKPKAVEDLADLVDRFVNLGNGK